MPGIFAERIQSLIRAADGGKLRGEVIVDQVYAQYQHEGLDLKHPDGGRAKYLGGPLIENYANYYNDMAKTLFHDGGQQAMINSMEDLSREVYDNAPREFMDLRASGHPIVHKGITKVYDRAPYVHRLNKYELKAKNQLRALGFGHGGGRNT